MKSLRQSINESFDPDIQSLSGIENFLQSNSYELVDLSDPKSEYGDITSKVDLTDQSLPSFLCSMDDIWGFLRVERPTTTDYYFVVDSGSGVYRFTYKKSTGKLQSAAEWYYDETGSGEPKKLRKNTSAVVSDLLGVF